MYHDIFTHHYEELHHYDAEYYISNENSFCRIKGKEYKNPSFICLISQENQSTIICGKINDIALTKDNCSFCYSSSSSGKVTKLLASLNNSTFSAKNEKITSDKFHPMLFVTFNALIMEVIIAFPIENEDARILRFDFFESDRENWLQKLAYLAAPFNVNLLKIFDSNPEE